MQKRQGRRSAFFFEQYPRFAVVVVVGDGCRRSRLGKVVGELVMVRSPYPPIFIPGLSLSLVFVGIVTELSAVSSSERS